MAKKTAEDLSINKLRQIATSLLKDDAMSAKDRAAVVKSFADDYADVILTVIEGQLALAAQDVLGDADEPDEDDEDTDEEDDEDEDDLDD